MATDKSIKRIELDEATAIDEEKNSMDEKDSSSEEDETVYLEDWSFVGASAQHDLTLIVEEHKIHVSKVVLSVASPVFCAMFEGGFKEKNLQEVELPDKKYEDFAEFLRCIYPNTLKSITEHNVCQVLPYVMEYQISPAIQEICQTSLIKVVRKNPEDVFKYIGLAELYNMEDLRTICVYIASESSEQCFEKATSLISDKNLFQIHLLNLKRNNLNKRDDQMLLKEGKEITKGDVYIHDKMTDKSRLTTVTFGQILEQYLNYNHSLHSSHYKERLRYVRLSYRFRPELLKPHIDYLRGRTPDTGAEELSLLPESVKQSMEMPELHKYFYPPLPCLLKPGTNNKK